MNEKELMAEAADAKHLSQFERHKFMVMVGGTIVISLGLVWVAMWLYEVSGAEQLDLSRPGYRSVSEKVVKNDEFESFSATGAIDESVTTEFIKRYDEQAKKLTSVDAFANGPMTDEALSLQAPKQ